MENVPSILNDKNRMFPNLPYDVRSGIPKHPNDFSEYYMFDETTVGIFGVCVNKRKNVSRLLIGTRSLISRANPNLLQNFSNVTMTTNGKTHYYIYVFSDHIFNNCLLNKIKLVSCTGGSSDRTDTQTGQRCNCTFSLSSWAAMYWILF